MGLEVQVNCACTIHLHFQPSGGECWALVFVLCIFTLNPFPVICELCIRNDNRSKTYSKLTVELVCEERVGELTEVHLEKGANTVNVLKVDFIRE